VRVTGILPVLNGGTNASTTQGAINNISGLTTNGDLLYNDGTNSTRLARGTNGQCLTANATTLVWTSCAGSGTTFFTLAGSSGTPQNLNGGDTLTVAAGSSGNISSVAGATDTVTVDIISNPTFSGLVTLQAGVTISAGQTLTINGEGFTDLTGTGLTMSGGALQSTLGTDIIGSEIADATIEEVDLEATNSPTDNYVLTYDLSSGGFTWVDPTSVGVGYSFSITDGTTPQTINDGNTLTVVDGTNIDVVTSATDTLTVSLINNPTLSGLLTLNGGLTVEVGDTFTFNGDAFTDLTGTGLQISSGSLQTTLGTSIQNAEVDDDLTVSAGGSVADGALSANVSLLGSLISLATEVTGTLPVTSGGTGDITPLGARTNLGAAASGANSDITSLTALTTITPTAALTVGATTQSLTLQGSGTSKFTATDSGFTTTVGFVAPTANATINFPALAAGTYSVCTTSGNCLGGGGGGANTALSNLSGVAINTSLLTGSATIDLGSDANPFRDLYLTGTMILEGSSADANEITLSVANPTADVTYRFADATAGTYDICTSTGNCVGSGGGSAPSGADYLTLSLNASLSGERVLTAGTNISTTDGGANSTLTVGLIANPTLSGLLTLNGGLTVEVGDTFTFNGDAFTDLTGTGLQISGNALQTTLGTDIDTGEITNGTILFADLSQNGCANDEVIKWSTGGSAWVCSPDSTGSGTNTFATIATPAGTSPVADNTTDTLTLANGSGITITGDGTTDTVTIAAVLGADVDLTSEVTGILPVLNGGTNASTTQGAINNISGLTTNGDLLYNDGTNSTRLARGTNGQCLTANATTLVWTSCAGSGTTFFTLAGSSGTPQNLNGGDTLTVAAGSSGNISSVAGATDTVTVDIISNPTFSGLVTLQAGVTISAGQTLTINGEGFTDLTGTGLTMSGGALQSTLGTDIIGSEIADATIEEVDLEATNSPTDNYVLTYDLSSGGFTWVDPTSVGVGYSFSITDGTTPQTINDGNTLTVVDGTNIDVVTSATDTLTVSLINNPTLSGLLTLNGGLTVEVGDTFTFNGDAFTDLTGTGLQISGNALQTTLGTDIDTGEITNGTILFADLSQNGCANDEVIKWSTGGSAWVCSPDSTGSGTNTFATIATPAGTSPVADNTTDTLTLANGSGITITGDGTTDTVTIAAVLGADVDLTSEVTGILPVLNGGTNASTTQGAINNISGLTTNGDLLYNDGTNSTRLARGTNGQCLTANATTLVWTSCAGSGTTFFTLAGSSGTPQNLNGGDTLTVAAGSSGNISSVAGATDTVTVDIISNPTFSGLVTLQAGVTISAGQTLTINGEGFTDLTGTGLTMSGGALQSTLGTDIIGSEIADATIEEVDLEATNSPTDNYVLTYDLSSGGFTWVDPTSVGVGYSFSITDGTTPQTINDGNTLTVVDGTNIDVVTSATDTLTVSLINNPTLSGLLTLNGGLTVEVGDTFTFNGDAFTDLTGTGLQISGNALQTTLGTDIDTGEITNGTILFADLSQNGCANDEVIKWSTGGSAWVCSPDATGSGTNTFATIATPAGTSPVADNTTDTLTLANGSGITITGDGTTDTVTIAAVLGADVDLTSEVTGILPVLNGGTNASTTQGAINNISGLTTNGDLLYNDGTNSTRLARGTNGQCLTANATTLVWTSCAGSGTTFFTLAGSSGTPQNLNGGDTLTVAAGSSGNISSVAGATDTVTVDIISNPTFSGLVTLQAGVTISAGQTLTINGEGFTDLTGTGLTMSGGALQSTLGTDIIGSEIADATIEEVDLEATNSPTDNYVLTYDLSSGGFTWVDPTSVGVGYSFSITDGTTPQTINDGNTLTVVDGTNIDVVTSATDTLTVSLINNPTLSGLLTLNGGLTVEVGDTFTFNGDAFTDLTGTGLQISGNALQTTLGTDIDTGEITNGTILFADLSQNGCANDEVIKWSTGGSAWVCSPDSTGSGTNTFATIATPAGTSPVADNTTDTLTLANGSGITITGDGTTDTVTIAAVLGADVDLTSEVTGILPVLNGGTNASTTQGAINNISGLTTNGDLLYNDGTNSTRLARGTNGQCLTANATTLVWTSCAGSGTTFFTLAGSSGTPQNLNGGDTLTVAAGSSGNISSVAGATDTVTVDIISNPTFSGLVTLQAGVTISAGQTLTINGEGFTDLTGTGLTMSGGALQSTLGTDIIGSEIADATIEEVDLEATNSPTDNYVLTYDLSSGGFTWVDPTSVGVGYSFSITDGTTPQTINDGNTLTVVDGTNIDVVTSATDTLTVSLINNPTLSGLLTLNGGLTVEVGDTFTFNGDAFTDLTGTGLQISGNAVYKLL
jgi:hypothetical protein